jgi:hypothetical protein
VREAEERKSSERMRGGGGEEEFLQNTRARRFRTEEGRKEVYLTVVKRGAAQL